MTQNDARSFEDVKARLDEIVEAVSSDDISLDDALKLYEEAVDLGLVASSLLEENLDKSNAEFDEAQASDSEQVAGETSLSQEGSESARRTPDTEQVDPAHAE